MSIAVLAVLIGAGIRIKCEGLKKIETKERKREQETTEKVKVTSLAFNLYISGSGYTASSEKLFEVIKYAKKPSDQEGLTLDDEVVAAIFNAPVAELFRKEQGQIMAKVTEALAEAKSTIEDLHVNQNEFPIQLKWQFDKFEGVISNYSYFFDLMDSKQVSVKVIKQIMQDSIKMPKIVEQLTRHLKRYLDLRKFEKISVQDPDSK